MKLYMAVTKDRFQLPEAVADSAAELARMCQTNRRYILSAIAHWKRGQIKTPRFITCEIEEEFDE